MPNPVSEAPSASPARVKSSSRVKEYAIVAVLLGVIVLAAAFQEPISAFIKMKKWDSGAAGRVVVQFLKDGKAGEKAKTDKVFSNNTLSPIERGGKFQGYLTVSMAGKMEFLFNDLCASGEPKVEKVTFDDVGGAAEVVVKDTTGKDVKYRLRMKEGNWTIEEILGGRPAK